MLNKINERPFDVNRRALGAKYRSVREFVQTDCKDGTGIAQLRQSIEREAERIEHLRAMFPARWFAIKEHLAASERNYLTFDEYRDFCRQYGETGENAQEELAGYLHALGVILNYRDDPRLDDMLLLDPHWVTNAIYKILNAKKVEQQRGEVHLNDLAEILDERAYPTSMRRFILDLMKKFDLCFSFPGDDGRHLIPELLGKQEPDEARGFDPRECLNFQYHYPAPPNGLLPRFIVRTHALSEGQPRWHTGTILQYEGASALVKANVQDWRVIVNVRGPVLERRSLLALIRSSFNEIHRAVPLLKPQEMVPLPGFPEVVVPYQKLLVMEQHGIEQVPEVVGGKVLTVNVKELLNGVDVDDTRVRRRGGQRRGSVSQRGYSLATRTRTRSCGTSCRLISSCSN